MRRLLPMVVLATMVPAAPAAATSCPAPRPIEQLGAADAAIVGEVTERRDDRVIIAVRERFKGDVGSVVEVPYSSNIPGSDVGAGGDVTGLFLHREGGVWRSSWCDRVEPAQLRAAVRARRAGGGCPAPRVTGVTVRRSGRLVRFRVRAQDRDGRPADLVASFGDGVSERRKLAPRGAHSGVVAFGHRFRNDRSYTVRFTVSSRASALCGGWQFTRRGLTLQVSSA